MNPLRVPVLSRVPVCLAVVMVLASATLALVNGRIEGRVIRPDGVSLPGIIVEAPDRPVPFLVRQSPY